MPISEHRLLILHYDEFTRTAYLFSRADFLLRRSVLRGFLTAQKGNYAICHYDELPVYGLIQVDRIEEGRIGDYISIDSQGQLLLKSWIGFSCNPRHCTFTRKWAFADWYGLVDSSNVEEHVRRMERHRKIDGHRMFTCILAVNDLDYKRSGGRLFKVLRLRNEMIKRKPDILEFFSNLENFEDELRRGLQKTSYNSTKKEVQPQLSQTSTSSSSEAFLDDDDTDTDEYYSVAGDIETIKTSKMSIVVKKEKNEENLIVWLADIQKFAVLKKSCHGIEMLNDILGACFECEYEEEKVNGTTIRTVLTVIKRISSVCLPLKGHLINEGEQFMAEVEVDLSLPDENFNFWSFHTGIGVFNSPQIGKILASDSIELPTSRKKKYSMIMREYLGNQKARKMRVQCVLVNERIPRRMLKEQNDEEDERDKETIRHHVWRLYKLLEL